MPGVLKTPESGAVFSTVHCALIYLRAAVRTGNKINTTAPLWQSVASCYKYHLIASDSPELQNHLSVIFSPNRLMKSAYRLSVCLSVCPSMCSISTFDRIDQFFIKISVKAMTSQVTTNEHLRGATSHAAARQKYLVCCANEMHHSCELCCHIHEHISCASQRASCLLLVLRAFDST
jgi:hypothetical protein